MSELRKKLEELFLKIIDDPIHTKFASTDTLNAIIEYIKIAPKPVDSLDNIAMMALLNEQMKKSESKPKTVDPVIMMLYNAMDKFNKIKPVPNVKVIHINDDIADLLYELNPDFVDKFTIIRDSDNSAIGLQIR